MRLFNTGSASLAGARAVTAMLLALLSVAAVAEPVQVDGVRLSQSGDKLRLVFAISSPVKHRLFRLSNPDRVVLDLSNARAGRLQKVAGSGAGWLKRIRSASRNGGDLRLVLDLSRPAEPRSFILKPNKKYGYRLVLDLAAAGKPGAGVSSRPAPPPRRGRDVIVAIDAGHGGEDPGAVGRNRTREKDVVLSIARKLEALVNREPGMRAVMIRDGDYRIALRDRVRKAREQKADLFVSIHADSIGKGNASGSSVFALSENGATSEAARLLAARENAVDLIGGVSLGDKDENLARVLVDLSQRAAIEASLKVGSHVLEQLGKVNSLHKKKVEQAGFAVLKSPDIPSILVETAFISNPGEERKLNSAKHQQRLARAILNGVRAYFLEYAPPGTTLALRKQGKRYVIQPGDTISTIARRHRVRMDELRRNNGLRDDLLRVGDVLLIPATLGG